MVKNIIYHILCNFFNLISANIFIRARLREAAGAQKRTLQPDFVDLEIPALIGFETRTVLK